MGEEILLGIAVLGGLLLLGSKRVPEVAKAIGKAAGAATKDFQAAYKEGLQAYKEGLSSTQQNISVDTLLEVAKKLGITTEGKARDQISQEIIGKIQSSI
jgi:Sec-independent protein translocase protein TatA